MTHATDVPNWIPSMDTFGARLMLLRHTMGWNAKEAALACGFSQGSWREWEVFGRLPRDLAGVCNKINAATGVSAIWLMTGVPVTGPNDGGPVTAVVRHQGLEPRTRWLGASAGQSAAVIEFRRAA